MSNLEIWEKVRRVPEEHLKAFKRAGGFSGTAIKPMWSVKTMTEQFGPCGKGWGIDAPEFNTVAGDNRETLVYCTVSVWHGSPGNKIFGVGGDRVVTHIKANDKYNTPERWQNDDEAFKKAFTDAVGNALKFLGVGADIHMGLWDGNKYVDERPEEKAPPSKNQTSRDEFERMTKEIRNITSLKALAKWGADNEKATEALPRDWFDDLTIEYTDKKNELKKALAA